MMTSKLKSAATIRGAILRAATLAAQDGQKIAGKIGFVPLARHGGRNQRNRPVLPDETTDKFHQGMKLWSPLRLIASGTSQGVC